MINDNTTRELDNPQEEKKIKTAVNDISADTAAIMNNVAAISQQLPSLVSTCKEINNITPLVNQYKEKLQEATDVITKGVSVTVPTAELSQEHKSLLENLKSSYNERNKRWDLFCKAVASSGKFKVYTTALVSILCTAAIMFLIFIDSNYVWSHRAFIAAKEAHIESPEEEYSKAFIEMQGGWKARKACKERIVGMESKADKTREFEGILSDYTKESIEVREYKISIKGDPMVNLVCFHPSSGQKVNYRIHRNYDGDIVKVEIEAETKGKKEWIKLENII